jgi:hypothetical protein
VSRTLIGNARIIDGDPLADLGLLQQQDNLRLILKDGQVYKNTL